MESRSHTPSRVLHQFLPSSISIENIHDQYVSESFQSQDTLLIPILGGNQRDQDRLKAQKKAAAQGKGKKESGASLQKRKEAYVSFIRSPSGSWSIYFFFFFSSDAEALREKQKVRDKPSNCRHFLILTVCYKLYSERKLKRAQLRAPSAVAGQQNNTKEGLECPIRQSVSLDLGATGDVCVYDVPNDFRLFLHSLLLPNNILYHNI